MKEQPIIDAIRRADPNPEDIKSVSIIGRMQDTERLWSVRYACKVEYVDDSIGICIVRCDIGNLVRARIEACH